MAHVLIVDADRAQAEAVSEHMRLAGHQVTRLTTGAEALRACLRDGCDLVIADMALPDMLGTELTRAIRGERAIRALPILLISDRVDEIDRVVAFEVGADDYVTKPFSVRELSLRVRAVLRRQSPRPHHAGDLLGGVEIDVMAHRVLVDGREVTLSPLELRLLVTLRSHHGRVLARADLLNEVWRNAAGVSERTVDACVKRLRQKLGRGGDTIQTVRGVGYRFVAEDEESALDQD